MDKVPDAVEYCKQQLDRAKAAGNEAAVKDYEKLLSLWDKRTTKE